MEQPLVTEVNGHNAAFIKNVCASAYDFGGEFSIKKM